MNNIFKLIYSALAIIIIITVACKEQNPKPESVKKELTQEELIKKGKYLVETIGCGDCHSPKVFGPNGPSQDPERLLSGHPADMPLGKIDKGSLKDWVLFNHYSTAVVGPWGVSFAANLTSDASGIGNWTEEQFKKAMREGQYKGLDGTRKLLPPMPWPNYAKMTDEDLKAIFYYLKSTKPVRNVVPNPLTPTDL